jgi:ribokinase
LLTVGVGLCALDYSCRVKRFPGRDEKHDALAGSIQGGGPVPTALCTLSRLGGRAAFIGKCGADNEGELVRQELESFGVNTKAMIFDLQYVTPKAFIWVDVNDGARSVVLDRTNITDLQPEELDNTLLGKCRYLLIDGREGSAALAAAQIARDAGAEVILDAGSPRKNIEELLPWVDHLVVSKPFADNYTGLTEPIEAVKKLSQRHFKSVIVTIGKEGAIYSANGEIFHQPAFDVKAVDTTGAGDVFHGAFIFGLSQGWEFRQITKFACAVSAMKCRSLGGRAGIPTLAETEKFIKQTE